MDKQKHKVAIISSLLIAALSVINRFVVVKGSEWQQLFGFMGINFTLAIYCWYVIIYSKHLYVYNFRFQIKSHGSKTMEIILSSVICLAVAIPVLTLVYNLPNHYIFSITNTPFTLVTFLSVTVIRFTILISTIQIIKYMFEVSEEKQAIQVENEKLKRENLNAQFQALKQQVNPHFLFNSLNTLKSLVKVNDASSEEFIIRLSEVYRYLLQKNQSDMVSVQEELNILNAYVFMLKSRFGESLQVRINIEDAILDKFYLPPFTMQLLIENATKHNIVSQAKPLHFDVFSRGEILVVKNNLQPKINIEDSTGFGLENINRRYNYLCKQGIEIIKSDSEFIVELPLIQSQ
jgi:sensor histidine kinase YesM